MDITTSKVVSVTTTIRNDYANPSPFLSFLMSEKVREGYISNILSVNLTPSYFPYITYQPPIPRHLGSFSTILPVEIESTVSPTNGSAATIYKQINDSHAYLKLSNSSSTLTVGDSSVTGDNIQLYTHEDKFIATWNKKLDEDLNEPVGQFADFGIEPSSLTAFDGFVKNAYQTNIDYVEAPKAVRDPKYNRWVVTQTAHLNGEQQGTLYGTVDGTFTNNGYLDPIDGRNVLVRQLMIHNEDIYILVSNAQKYDSKLAKLEIRKWDPINKKFNTVSSSFEGRTSFAQIMVDTKNIPWLYFLDSEFKFKRWDFSNTVSNELLSNTDTTFTKNLCDGDFYLESMDYAYDRNTEKSYCVISCHGPNNRNYKITINLSDGTHRL